jgi:hypothetical protein
LTAGSGLRSRRNDEYFRRSIARPWLLKGAASCLTQSRPQKAANYPVFGYNLPMMRDDEKRIADTTA